MSRMNASQSGSRHFLNTLNPMGNQFNAFSNPNQSLLEEDENQQNNDDIQQQQQQQSPTRKPSSSSRSKRNISWDAGASEMNNLSPTREHKDPDSSDDEVPQSFMIEATASPPRRPSSKGKRRNSGSNKDRGQPHYSGSSRQVPPILPLHNTPKSPPPISAPPRPVDTEGGSGHIPPHGDTPPPPPQSPFRSHYAGGLSPREKALWNWVNVYNLDAFLQEVYSYYQGKGIVSIALARGINLLTIGFVIGFSTFLLGCIDYPRIRPDRVTRLSDVVVQHCVAQFSGFTLLFFILFIVFYVWQVFTFAVGVMRLVDMYNFYTYLLKIPNEDIQTISWSEVVRRIAFIREENPFIAHTSSPLYSAKLDAHDVANRIMRQENYLIALFNKELLDLRVPLPESIKNFMGPEKLEGKSKVQTLSKALEWNLRFCLMQYLFDHEGKVMKVFLKRKHRARLIEGLQRRFIFMGCLNAIFAPFIVPYILVYSFFRYFEEYQKNPSLIGGRRYTLFAQWKFREFNELPHLFNRRLDESHQVSSIYIGQFPNENMTLIMKFVAFVSGSFAGVLGLAALLDADLIAHFEITPHRTILFYIGLFATILAVVRGMIPEDNRVFDPEMLMEEVIVHTHYMPDEWKDKLHSKQVHQQFGELFSMRILTFVQEILSVILTPFVLWFALPACAPAIIDFFRDFSVHVEGRGYVCSFAEFNFERHGNVKFGAPAQAEEDQRMVSNEGKMEKSFLNFKAQNPDWTPNNTSGSMFLSRMAELHVPLPHISHSHLSHSQLSPRRRQVRTEPGLDGTILLGAKPESKAQEYDRALMQSQHAAALRRRQHASGSIMASVAPGGPGTGMGGISASSVFGGPALAQTVALGDSQGSLIALAPSSPPPTRTAREAKTKPIDKVDVTGDGGVDSRLGDSYDDGTGRGDVDDGDEGLVGESVQDGGVMGLLAQIYGAGMGSTRRRPTDVL
ncbi:autophagy protein Apg9-domain-containing protein [Pterulicium gracile]|uniref:Autophagy-related protein 9 n=1 Tax=Pterulicium gracile TaxID=1884261 RepID=A0A5C3QM31_9AGAR|nr:autophagy protein Apg9-domain-containing protein [Pterula gracilis]